MLFLSQSLSPLSCCSSDIRKVKSPPPGSGAGVKGQRSRKFSDLAEESERYTYSVVEC